MNIPTTLILASEDLFQKKEPEFHEVVGYRAGAGRIQDKLRAFVVPENA